MKTVSEIYGMVNKCREQVIKAMQERGVKKVNLVMSPEEFCKENGFDFENEGQWESNYDDYKCQEAPYVIYFNKWGNGIDYRVLSVTLKDGTIHPRFELECEADEEGDETFCDDEVQFMSMLNVYAAIGEELGIEEDPETVWVFTAEQAWDGEVAETIVKVFATEKAATDYLREFVHVNDDGDETATQYVERRGWKTEHDEPMLYRAYEDGDYALNHIECTITECKIGN